jgi:hypothetical protein
VANQPGENVVGALSWGRSDVVHVVVTTVGLDGVKRRWYPDLRRDRPETIELPHGTRAVTIERRRRVRVVLGLQRVRRSG